MAASKPVVVKEEVLRNELGCPVCLKEPRLHLLPCAHRCCMTCVDRLAGEARELECPLCRRPTAVPDQGFPICVLTERIKDELKFARENAENANTEKPTSKGQETTKCEGCSKSDVESRCRVCLKFLCFRCGGVKKDCRTSNKHDIEAIEEILEENQALLKDWQTKTNAEVTTLTGELTSINNKHTALNEERKTLQTKVRAVEAQIVSIEQNRRYKQAQLDDKSSRLKVTEVLQSEGDSVEIIRLTEQICAQNEAPAVPKSQIQPANHLSPVPSPPTSIQFVSEHSTSCQCGSVDHHSITGDILLGCDDDEGFHRDGMKMLIRSSGEVKTITNHVSAKAIEHNGELFLSHLDNTRTVIKVLKFDLHKKTSEALFSFRMNTQMASHLSVSNRYIACVNKDNNTIKLYDRQKAGPFKELTTLSPNLQKVMNLRFITDNTLLVTGWNKAGDLLNKYRVSGNNIQLVWSSKDVPHLPSGIAVDERGMIYVSGMRTKTIFVLNPEGKINSNLEYESHLLCDL